ncbi:PREDICTED: uncharacterized protein LOC108569475 [Nicrophorus vespilloides]|uniref:Uncharacterized protein LOC108569475 n=1 Tax=Nicrophorus vespilloides TaxID=110193 RepID=A0ABM1NI79_NICVS|nr:PREDICTED: uncharacterized protein LOC108569475 [Nicrophorus vespilloides]XP_017786530.1 PREDICTED: uncharacterized protein LOC108569475 [Nicrophorus vespilloides]
MSEVEEDVSLIHKILMCICCVDGPRDTNLPSNNQPDGEQSQTTQYGSSGLHQVVQDNGTPTTMQPHGIERVSPNPQIVRPRPQVHRLPPTVAVPPLITARPGGIHNTWNRAQLTPTPVVAPQFAKPIQDAYSAFESYNVVRIPPTATVVPQNARPTTNVQNTSNLVPVPPTYKPVQVPPTPTLATIVQNTYKPVQVPKTVAPKNIKTQAYHRFKSKNVAKVPSVEAAVPRNDEPKTRGSNAPETLPPDLALKKQQPKLYNQNESSSRSSDNLTLKKDMIKLNASVGHIKVGKNVEPLVLKTNFESSQEFRECMSVHLGKELDDSLGSSSSSSVDELDEEYYMNRPTSIFTIEQRNPGESDANVSNGLHTAQQSSQVEQVVPAAAKTHRSNGKRKKWRKRQKKNTAQQPKNMH